MIVAQRVITQLVSDLSGQEIAEGDGETVNFALDGKDYELDLTNKEADKLRGTLQNYIAAGLRAGDTSRGARRTTATARASNKEELAAIRSWARKNGYEVADRGRIQQAITDAYHSALGR